MLQYIDDESYSIMILCMIFFTGLIAPLVKKLYKPRTYKSQKRRTVLHSRPDSELRLLACIFRENCTSSLLNLLEVSNPSFESPICFYLVHLLVLDGRSTSMLVSHRPGKKTPARAASSEHIINAFKLYQQQNVGTLIVNPFTSIAPFVTIHQDVCELALDKRVAMVIIPFHKRFTMEHTDNFANSTIRTVNRNILENSPCSVGILVDRGTLPSNTLLFARRTSYRILLVFIGGPDDREALAYAMRMAEHPNVNLTVIQLVDSSLKDQKHNQRRLDFDLINEFKLANVGSKSLVFKEERVADGLEIIATIQGLENKYELVLVGRSHVNDSAIFGGLTEWNEFPELGCIGDMLASSDSKCKASLLVVQQQIFSGDGKLESSPFIEGPAFAVADMGKAWPHS